MNMEFAIEELAVLIQKCNRIVCFTGAGISTDSGIPDFRSPDGVWAKNRQILFDEFMSSPAARHEYWRQKCESFHRHGDSVPNMAHRTIARWEEHGKVAGVITQNIDGLHQQAGSRNVLEIHGTAIEVMCMDCNWRGPAEPLSRSFLETGRVPSCEQCATGRLKHATISFGQSLDEAVLNDCKSLAESADMVIAFGSSLMVEPAASMPLFGLNAGAFFAIINREATDKDAYAHLTIHGEISDVLEELFVCWGGRDCPADIE